MYQPRLRFVGMPLAPVVPAACYCCCCHLPSCASTAICLSCLVRYYTSTNMSLLQRMQMAEATADCAGPVDSLQGMPTQPTPLIPPRNCITLSAHTSNTASTLPTTSCHSQQLGLSVSSVGCMGAAHVLPAAVVPHCLRCCQC